MPRVAVLESPVVLFKSAPAPVAVLLSAVLSTNVPAPIPVLNLPSVTLGRENQPTAVLYVPLVRLRKGVLSFCRIPPWIGSVWEGNNRLHHWAKCKAAKRQENQWPAEL